MNDLLNQVLLAINNKEKCNYLILKSKNCIYQYDMRYIILISKMFNNMNSELSSNGIIAIACQSGYGQEDTLSFDKESRERGLFRAASLKKYIANITKNQNVNPNKTKKSINNDGPIITEKSINNDGLIIIDNVAPISSISHNNNETSNKNDNIDNKVNDIEIEFYDDDADETLYYINQLLNFDEKICIRSRKNLYKIYNFFDKYEYNIIITRIFYYILKDLIICICPLKNKCAHDHLTALNTINQLVDDMIYHNYDIMEQLKNQIIVYIKKYFIGLADWDWDRLDTMRNIKWLIKREPLYEQKCKETIDNILKSKIFDDNDYNKEILHLLHNLFDGDLKYGYSSNE